MGVLTPEATLLADRPVAGAPALRFGAMVGGMGVWMMLVKVDKGGGVVEGKSSVLIASASECRLRHVTCVASL